MTDVVFRGSTKNPTRKGEMPPLIMIDVIAAILVIVVVPAAVIYLLENEA